MTKLLRIDESSIDFKKIGYAAKEILKGKLVVFPTETVYGIGANAFNENACKEIFRVKNRAADNPLIVHICNFKQLDEIAFVPNGLLSKIKRLWPGPVTFVLKNKSMPAIVTAGLETVAIRMPSNPIAIALIQKAGVPIAAPSANISTFPSATEARHALSDFDGKVAVIIDGGKSRFGLESTVVNLSNRPYKVLRPGALDVEELKKVFGKVIVPKNINKTVKSGKVASPGMKYRHYSPRTPLFLLKNISDMKKAYTFLLNKKEKFAVIVPIEYADGFKGAKIIVLGSIKDPISIARNLFSSFRELDETGVNFGIISELKLSALDMAVRNRMEKAAGKNMIINLKDFTGYFR